MKALKIEAYVLRGNAFGESHKIMTLFTRQLGIIKVITYGIRKTKSKLGSAFELMNEVSLVVTPAKQKDLYNIKEVSILSSLHSIRDNLRNINHLYYLAEFLDSFIQKGVDEKEIYALLKETLLQCEKQTSSLYELLRSFELKSLKILGFLPDLNHCSQCGQQFLLKPSSKEKVFLSVRDGWIFCQNCKNPHIDFEITLGTYRFLNHFLTYKINYIPRLKINDFFKKETDLACRNLIISILGKEFNSSKWLNLI